MRGDSGPDQAEEDKTEDDDAECLPFTELEDDEALTKINTLLNVYPATVITCWSLQTINTCCIISHNSFKFSDGYRVSVQESNLATTEGIVFRSYSTKETGGVIQERTGISRSRPFRRARSGYRS